MASCSAMREWMQGLSYRQACVLLGVLGVVWVVLMVAALWPVAAVLAVAVIGLVAWSEA